MKWWYVALVIFLGLILGWWVFWKNSPKSKIVYIPQTSAETINSLNLPTRVIGDKKGVTKNTVELTGTTTKWHPDIGILEFSNNGKNYSLEIDPKTAIIYTPGRKTQGVTILVSDKKSPHWNNIFCDGDAVTLRLDGNKVVFADNSGFRYCGFKADQ